MGTRLTITATKTVDDWAPRNPLSSPTSSAGFPVLVARSLWPFCASVFPQAADTQHVYPAPCEATPRTLPFSVDLAASAVEIPAQVTCALLMTAKMISILSGCFLFDYTTDRPCSLFCIARPAKYIQVEILPIKPATNTTAIRGSLPETKKIKDRIKTAISIPRPPTILSCE